MPTGSEEILGVLFVPCADCRLDLTQMRSSIGERLGIDKVYTASSFGGGYSPELSRCAAGLHEGKGLRFVAIVAAGHTDCAAEACGLHVPPPKAIEVFKGDLDAVSGVCEAYQGHGVLLIEAMFCVRTSKILDWRQEYYMPTPQTQGLPVLT